MEIDLSFERPVTRSMTNSKREDCDNPTCQERITLKPRNGKRKSKIDENVTVRKRKTAKYPERSPSNESQRSDDSVVIIDTSETIKDDDSVVCLGVFQRNVHTAPSVNYVNSEGRISGAYKIV